MVKLGLQTFLPFPHYNSISFWHTIMILHTWIDHDPRRTTSLMILESRSQGHIWTLNFAPFPHNHSIIFWHTMMVLDAFVACDPEEHPYWFWVKRSKVKVRFSVQTFHHFHTVSLTFWPITLGLLHTIVFANDPRRTPIDFWVKRSRPNFGKGVFDPLEQILKYNFHKVSRQFIKSFMKRRITFAL